MWSWRAPSSLGTRRGRAQRLVRPRAGGRALALVAEVSAAAVVRQTTPPSRRAVRAALTGARVAQDEYDAGRRAIGERALRFAREQDYPAVVVVGENHVIHDPSLNTGIHDLIGANGAVAVPGDCYPLPAGVPDVPRMHWASGGAALRTVLAARLDGDVFPLLLGAYGCGPNSLIEPLFGEPERRVSARGLRDRRPRRAGRLRHPRPGVPARRAGVPRLRTGRQPGAG